MTRAACDRFWDFSLDFYARPGVPAACLALQEGAGADVNVVLFLLHLAAHGRALDGAEIADIDAAVAGWRAQVVQPLRAARRALKAPPAAFAGESSARLRTAVKRDELEAERLQQLTMEALFPPAATGRAGAPAAAARANLDAYAARLPRPPAAALATLLAAFAGG